MRSVWRLVVICLLAVALPMQGVAAATMLHGGPVAAAHAPSSPNAAAAHDHADHYHGAAHAAGDVADAADDGGVDTGHRCSTCAACCAAHALPARPVVLTSVPTDSSVADTPDAGHPSPDLDRLDRPPRIALA